MIALHCKNRRGFSLVEISIVLGVAGMIFGAIWNFSASARQSIRLERSKEDINALVDATRIGYAPLVNITGDVSAVFPQLIQAGNIGAPILRAGSSACNGITNYYADTPWQGPTYDVCGTLRLCAWTYSTNTACGTPAASGGAQFFAVEFRQLDFGSCASLAQNIMPNAPAGLKDVYINGNSAVLNAATLPVLPAFAQNRAPYVGMGCANNYTNVVDFIYSLRPPSN
jgi:prepilin-type N-terminal cleavage/methylation domain-containing protein